MNRAYLTDDVSLRKNDFFIHLAREVNVYWVVCAEFRKDEKSNIDVQRDAPPPQWRAMAAYPYLKNLDVNRPLIDEGLWHDQLPGIWGLDASEFPKHKEKRVAYFRSVTTDANRLDADVVFWDLSTGIASQIRNDAAESMRNVDPCYIYWDELRQVVESTKGITCFYQHGRRASWNSIYQEYEAALGRTIRFRDEQPLALTIARAKAVFIPPPDSTDKLCKLSKIISRYAPGVKPDASGKTVIADTPAMDEK